MKQLVQDRMNSFLFLIPFLKSNGETEFEKHGCSVKKKKSTVLKKKLKAVSEIGKQHL